MRKKYAFFGNYQAFFAEEKAEKIQSQTLPQIVDALLTKPLIFADLAHVELLESYCHIITLQLEKFDKFEAEHTKGYKLPSRSEVLEKSRSEAQNLRE